MIHKLRASPWASGAAVACLLLAACSGSGSDGHATATTTPRPAATLATASATARPAVAKPTIPPEMSQANAKGAEAFFRYFWEVYNYAQATQDIAALKAISDPDCIFCSGTYADINKDISLHHHAEGGTVEVRTVAAPPDDVRGSLIVSGTLAQQEIVNLDASGKLFSRVPASTHIRVDALEILDKAGWRLLDIHVYGKNEK